MWCQYSTLIKLAFLFTKVEIQLLLVALLSSISFQSLLIVLINVFTDFAEEFLIYHSLFWMNAEWRFFFSLLQFWNGGDAVKVMRRVNLMLIMLNKYLFNYSVIFLYFHHSFVLLIWIMPASWHFLWYCYEIFWSEELAASVWNFTVDVVT
jgi:hypothetical protein